MFSSDKRPVLSGRCQKYFENIFLCVSFWVEIYLFEWARCVAPVHGMMRGLRAPHSNQIPPPPPLSPPSCLGHCSNSGLQVHPLSLSI